MLEQRPPQPERYSFTDDGVSEKLVRNVRAALGALPAYFQSGTRIEGLDGGELFSLSGVLGGAIEHQVVDTLNRIRDVWDPDDEWPRHRFVRYAQTFPDVRLEAREDRGGSTVALGIELKGWYLLSKEREPSFRYTVTPAACSHRDLLAVVPWHLKNLLSGEPIVYEPYIEQAGYVAQLRNWWWTYIRDSKDAQADRQVYPPEGEVDPYPPPKARISDRPAKDGGNNFGRVARIDSLMKWYVDSMLGKLIAGIPADHWTRFFKLHAEARNADQILEQMEKTLTRRGDEISAEAVDDVVEAIRRIVNLFN